MIERRHSSGASASPCLARHCWPRARPATASRSKGVYSSPGLSFSAHLPRRRAGPLGKERPRGGTEAGAGRSAGDGGADQSRSDVRRRGLDRSGDRLGQGDQDDCRSPPSPARWPCSSRRARTGCRRSASRRRVRCEDKLKAFKGARVGASTIGGGPAQYTRYLARTVGLDPERDMKIVAVGFGAARMAALRTNQVDLTVGVCAGGRSGRARRVRRAVFSNCPHEVPIFREFPYTVVVVTPAVRQRAARRRPPDRADARSGQRHVPHELR